MAAEVDKNKSKAQLLAELESLRAWTTRLEISEKYRQQAEIAIRKIVADASGLQAEPFFNSIVRQFSGALSSSCTFIGELVNTTGKPAVRTLSLCIDGKIKKNFEYLLAETPCENVMGKNLCTYPSGVAEKFPKDHMLKQMGAQCYVGVPLFDSRDQANGIMVSIFRRELSKPELEFVESIFRIFAPRAAAEVERIHAQQALRESETMFRQIVEASPMGIFLYRLDEDDRLIFIGSNPAADQILGVECDKFLGKTIEEAFPPLKETEIPMRYRRAASLGESWSTRQIEYRDEKISGAYEVYAFRIKSGVMAAMFLDITERTRIEAEKRRLRNLLSNIVNSMPSQLIGVDLGGRVIQWSRQVEKETGVMAAQALGKPLDDIYPRLAEQMTKVRRAISNGTVQKEERVPYKKENLTRFLDIATYPLLTNGNVEGAVVRIDDVTDRIRLEEAMVQSEKMITVGGLAVGMAHEINNPLAGIIQNTQVIRNRLTPGLPANEDAARESGTTMEAVGTYVEKRRILTMLDMVLDSGARAAEVVRNMLGFIRRPDGGVTRCRLPDLLDKTLELAANDYNLKKKYNFRSIEIHREYADPMPPVLCDEAKIQQVFLNILKNGAQAMEAKGEADKPRFILRIKPDGVMARIEIEDNGSGMPEDVRKRVFEPFFSTRQVGDGTGLGLSIAYFIVSENHKGTLTVESTPNVGSNFIVRLPLEEENKGEKT